MSTLKLILNAAKEVACQYGVSHSTTKRICDLSGVSKSNVYYYFRSNSEIMSVIHEEYLNQVLNRIDDDVINIDNIIGVLMQDWKKILFICEFEQMMYLKSEEIITFVEYLQVAIGDDDNQFGIILDGIIALTLWYGSQMRKYGYSINEKEQYVEMAQRMIS